LENVFYSEVEGGLGSTVVGAATADRAVEATADQAVPVAGAAIAAEPDRAVQAATEREETPVVLGGTGTAVRTDQMVAADSLL